MSTAYAMSFHILYMSYNNIYSIFEIIYDKNKLLLFNAYSIINY